MPRQKKETLEEDEEVTVATPEYILSEHLKNNTNQFNLSEIDNADYKVSTGSLKVDIETGGGFGAGIIRFCGVSEGGKTSEALEVMRNFLETVPNSRGIFIKAEGRLSEQVRVRSGIKFTKDDGSDWQSGDGTKEGAGNCFVYKNNVFDDVIALLETLIDLRDGTKYCIIIDSLDGLNLQADLDKAKKNTAKRMEKGNKAESEEMKVAGAPKLTKEFFKRMSLPICELGHMTILLSQVSSNISISQYVAGPIRKLSGTGGNAAMHFPDWIFDFQQRSKDDLILQNPNAKFDSKNPEKNPIIGHWCKFVVRKSTTERSEVTLRYPIRYGMKGGKSIWTAYEVTDLMIGMGLVERSGAWMQFSEFAVEKMEEAGITLESTKIQGLPRLQTLFDSDQKLSQFWYKYLCDNILGELELE